MRYAFDIELYRNFFSMITRNILTNKKYEFVTFEDRDDRDKLKRFLSTNPTLIGFNSKDYDLPVMNYFMNGATIESTFGLSSQIINKTQFEKLPSEYYRMRDNHNIDGIDLMSVLSIRKQGVSLKHCGIVMQWKLLQELPLPPDTFVSKSQVPILLDYNDNDVLITLELSKEAKGDISLREFIHNEFGVNVMNSDESNIGNELMTNLYSESTGLNYMMFREGRTYRDKLNVSDCIGKNIEFVSTEMKKFYTDFSKMSFIPNDKTFGIALDYCHKRLNVKLGGLHSIDKPGKFETNNDKIIIHADVRSNYPIIILENNIKPAHLRDNFYEIYKNLVDTRIEAKDNKEYLKADALKIVINSVFGKMNYEDYWLYDPLAFYSVTISGQLYLLSLIDLLETNGIDVISANTDGVVSYIKRDKLDLYYEICHQWQAKTHMGLDFDIWNKYVRRDGNNYLAVEDTGKLKTKGVFFDVTNKNVPISRRVSKSYNMPILKKALKNYFVDGIDINDTIMNSQSIHDFLITQKPGKKFQVEFNGETVQRINRFYVSTNGGELQKAEKDKAKRKLSLVAEQVSLANNIPDDRIVNYPDLDYSYYINQVRKIIEKIEPATEKIGLF